MFTVRASKKNQFKPQRGGMARPVAVHAAPTGLGWITGRDVTINMSPRWGLALAGARMDWPNHRRQRSPRFRCVCMLSVSGAPCLSAGVSENMNPGERQAKRAFLVAFIASTLVLGGLAFGFLRTFTALPVWACVSISLPSGALVFIVLLWLGVSSDGPFR